MIERRKFPRQKSLLRGVVCFSDANYTMDCMVRDISQTGARIRFDAPPSIIPDCLELKIPVKGQTYRGKVIWCSGNEIGIAFETNVGVSAPVSNDNSASISNDELSVRVSRLETEIVMLKQLIKRLQQDTANKVEVA